MKTHTVYLEFCGKNLKVKVLATDKNDAQSKVIGMINFHKIETDTRTYNNPSKPTTDSVPDFMKDIFKI